METITYLELNNQIFNQNSLDEFIRHQEVKECWRKNRNNLVLVPNQFTEDWNLQKRREIARTIEQGISNGNICYGAFDQKKIVGYILLANQLFGTKKQYIELILFHVSEPYRNKGIGKELFKRACKGAREEGATKLYISAHSSKESQAAYRKLGCIDAVEVNMSIAENEPFDIQMEYQL